MGKTTNNILMVGVGGQGIILASDVFVHAALEAGFDVKKSEIHGMSQRGGSVFSHVRFGEQVLSPVIPRGQAHILASLEEMETLRWIDYASQDTRVIMSRHRILPAEVTEYPEGIEAALQKQFPQFQVVDSEAVDEKTGSIRYLNVVLLGLLSTSLDIPEKAWHSALEALVPEGTYQKNLQAFDYGKELG